MPSKLSEAEMSQYRSTVYGLSAYVGHVPKMHLGELFIDVLYVGTVLPRQYVLGLLHQALAEEQNVLTKRVCSVSLVSHVGNWNWVYIGGLVIHIHTSRLHQHHSTYVDHL